MSMKWFNVTGTINGSRIQKTLSGSNVAEVEKRYRGFFSKNAEILDLKITENGVTTTQPDLKLVPQTAPVKKSTGKAPKAAVANITDTLVSYKETPAKNATKQAVPVAAPVSKKAVVTPSPVASKAQKVTTASNKAIVAPADKKVSHVIGRDTWQNEKPIVDIDLQPVKPWWVDAALKSTTHYPKPGVFSYPAVYLKVRELAGKDYTKYTVSELLTMLETYCFAHPADPISEWYGKSLDANKLRDLTARLWWCMPTALRTIDVLENPDAARQAKQAEKLAAKNEKTLEKQQAENEKQALAARKAAEKEAAKKAKEAEKAEQARLAEVARVAAEKEALRLQKIAEKQAAADAKKAAKLSSKKSA